MRLSPRCVYREIESFSDTLSGLLADVECCCAIIASLFGGAGCFFVFFSDDSNWGSRKRKIRARWSDVPWLAVGLSIGHQSVTTRVSIISRLILLAPGLVAPELQGTQREDTMNSQTVSPVTPLKKGRPSDVNTGCLLRAQSSAPTFSNSSADHRCGRPAETAL